MRTLVRIRKTTMLMKRRTWFIRLCDDLNLNFLLSDSIMRITHTQIHGACTNRQTGNLLIVYDTKMSTVFQWGTNTTIYSFLVKLLKNPFEDTSDVVRQFDQKTKRTCVFVWLFFLLTFLFHRNSTDPIFYCSHKCDFWLIYANQYIYCVLCDTCTNLHETFYKCEVAITANL